MSEAPSWSVNDRAFSVALAKLLGLDPTATKTVRIELDGNSVRISWEGFKLVSASKAAQLLKDAETLAESESGSDWR